MSKKIIWAPLAVDDFASILDFVSKNWENKVANQFIDRVQNAIAQISGSPKQFPLFYRKEKIRRCVLTKHNSFYREIKTQIDILRIFDTRQDPDTLKFN
jgi:plasmid stabilization system protein ParE